jgi:hypothetical protein
LIIKQQKKNQMNASQSASRIDHGSDVLQFVRRKQKLEKQKSGFEN